MGGGGGVHCLLLGHYEVSWETGSEGIPNTVLQGYFSFQVTSHKEVNCPQSLVNCQYDYMGCSIKVIEQCSLGLQLRTSKMHFRRTCC